MYPPDPFAHRYNSLRLVGRGGFGAVYRAWDTELDREVALKLLNANLATDPDWRRRFKQEATAASKLNHQNITIVHDRGEYEGQPFIVMEFVEGEPLSKIIEHQVSLTDPERLFLLEQLCDGLHYAHQRNIVHRDIKPVNLVVREEHDGTHMVRTLKILDFGIAKIVNAGQTATGGQLMFTPNYVSPEQIRGLEVDRRSDIFAVGAVAYELLVFQKAFIIRTTNPFAFLEEVKLRIVEMPHRPMTEVRPDVDPELIAIVDRALQKAPENRYRDLAEMRRRIRAVRERMEEALARAGSSQTTVVLNPQLQQEVKRARESLEAANPTAAVERLEQALASAPNQLVRRFIEEELEEARERLSAERAGSKARDEQAARDAIAAATAAFEQGNGTAAILALEQFEPRVLVAEQIALLTRASALIHAAEHAVTEGTRAERETALRELQEFSPRTLVNEALTRLGQRAVDRRAEEERARERDEAERAKQAIDAAHDVFRQGDAAAAIRALEQFEPRELVAEEIALLTRAGALIQATEHAVTKGAPAEREAALRELQGFSPLHLVSQSVARLAQRAADRRAEEERARERAEADRAKQAIDAAQEVFRQGDGPAAIRTLEQFEPRALVAGQIALLARATELIDAAERAVTEGPRAEREAALRDLDGFSPRDLLSQAATRLGRRSAERFAKEERIRERDEAERAQKAIDAAREMFRLGRWDEAIASLEQAEFPARIAPVLQQLREAAALIRRATVIVQTGTPAARAQTLEKVEVFADPWLVERALDDLRAVDGTRRSGELEAAAMAVVEGAVADFEAGNRRAAFDALERFEPRHPRVVKALSRLHDRNAELEAEERARADADGLIARVRVEFAHGRRDDAIAALVAFDRAALVAPALVELRRAAEAIDAATQTVQNGERNARERALATLSRFAPADLVLEAVRELQGVALARDAAEDQAAAQAADARAQDAIDLALWIFRTQGEKRDKAITGLERFKDVPRVAAALDRLRRAKDAIDTAAAVVRSGDPAARVAALDELAAFADGELVAEALVELRAVDDERRAAEEHDGAAAALIESAQAQFESGDRPGALTRLEQFQPLHADVTAALAELRTRATNLVDQEQRERDARDLIATARATFAEGRRAEAVALLERTRHWPMVGDALQELRRADDAIAAVERAIEHGDEAARAGALAALAQFEPADLVDAALPDLRKRAAQRTADERELQEAAAAAGAQARALFLAGDTAQALAVLEAFRGPELVAETLVTLRQAEREINAARASVTTGAAAARQTALARLARLEPPDLFEQPLIELRQIDDSRSEDEARVEAERQAAEAKRATALAIEQFLSGECETAIGTLAAFQPAPLVEATLAELREAWRAIEHARHIVAEGDDDTRQRAIEELRVFTLQALVESAAERLQQEHLERRAAEQRERERHERKVAAAREEIAQALASRSMRRAERALRRAEEAFPNEPFWTPMHAQLQALKDVLAAEPSTFARAVTRIRQAPLAAKAAAALLVLVLILSSVYVFKLRSPDGTSSKTDPDPSATNGVPARNYANELAAAQQAYSQGRTKDAIDKALLVYGSAQGDPQTGAATLLRQIRTAAENDASTARGLADKAQATAETDYRDGVSKQSAAQVMDDAKSTEGAVALYGEAAQHFRRAATTAWQPVDFMRQAMQEYTGGRVTRAIEYLQQALRRDAAYEPALGLLAKIRQQARTRATQARADLKGRATKTTQYRDAEAKMQNAEKLTAVDDAPRQLEAYTEAEDLYNAAALAANAELGKELGNLVQQATKEYGDGKVPQAIANLQQALLLETAHKPALDLLAKIRQQAESAAVEARAALKGTASNTTQFKDAEGKMRSAEKLTGVEDAPRQVQAYNEAEGLYKAAGEEARTFAAAAAKRHADAQEHLRLAQKFLDAREFTQADSEIDKALALERSDEASALRKKVDGARRTVALEARDQKIKDLVDRSTKATDAEAVSLLTQALDLDSSRDDLRKERERRRGPKAPPPPDLSREQDVAAIRATVMSYKAAHEKLSVEDIVKVAPYWKPMAPGLERVFAGLRRYKMEIQEDAIDINGLAAKVRCRITKVMDTQTSGRLPPVTERTELTLQRTSGGWLIVGVVSSR